MHAHDWRINKTIQVYYTIEVIKAVNAVKSCLGFTETTVPVQIAF